MGISMSSALIIATSDTEISISESDGKFSGAICHGRNHAHHPLMVIVDTPFVFDTREIAQTKMEQLIQDIKDQVELKVQESKSNG